MQKPHEKARQCSRAKLPRFESNSAICKFNDLGPVSSLSVPQFPKIIGIKYDLSHLMVVKILRS